MRPKGARWALKGGEVDVHLAFASGQDEEYHVQVVWPGKLGLRLRHPLPDEGAAQKLAQRVAAKGVIDVRHWEKFFLEDADQARGFGSTFAD